MTLEKYRKNDLYKKLDCIKINPYIPNESKWYKLMFYKRSGSFHYFPKENFTFKEFYQRFKLVFSRSKGSKIDWCDYSFDILKFLVDKKFVDKNKNGLYVVSNSNSVKEVDKYRLENVNKIAEVSCKLFNAARIRKN